MLYRDVTVCTMVFVTNPYEAAARQDRVETIVAALLALPEIGGDVTRLDPDHVARVPTDLRNEFAGLQSGSLARRAPSDETWDLVVRSIRTRQRLAATDPFAGL